MPSRVLGRADHVRGPRQFRHLGSDLAVGCTWCRDRVLAGFEVLKAQPQTDTRRIGALGYCFGGQCVLELARSGAEVRAVVSFHGLLRARIPAEPGVVKSKVLALTGMLDPYAP